MSNPNPSPIGMEIDRCINDTVNTLTSRWSKLQSSAIREGRKGIGMKKKSVTKNTAPEITPRPSGLCRGKAELTNNQWCATFGVLHFVPGGLVQVSPTQVPLHETISDSRRTDQAICQEVGQNSHTNVH
jgi:hypothetical protein